MWYSLFHVSLMYRDKATGLNNRRGQWRIKDFPEEGAQLPRGGANIRFCKKFPKNCMKLREFGPQGGGGRVQNLTM